MFPFNVRVIFVLLCALWKNALQNIAFAAATRTFFKQSPDYITTRNSFQNKMDTTNTPAATTATPTAANTTASLRTRILEAIKEASYEPTAQETHNDQHAQVRLQRDTWWNHIVATFFLGDEARMFRELRIGRDVFEEIVNAVAESRSSAAAADVSFSPTTNAFCFCTSSHSFRCVLRTPFTFELSTVLKTVSHCVGGLQHHVNNWAALIQDQREAAAFE